MPLTRRTVLALAPGTLACSSIAVAAQPATGLARDFLRPPDGARPWVYWFWKNGNISRAGITADLEAMQRVGIGGLILMEVRLSTPAGPLPFFSAGWREMFRHAVAEAHRLGLKVDMNSAPGWTGSGGAWVTPEQSMQKVTSAEIETTGPRRFSAVLPQPPVVKGYYRDIAVLAFPSGADYRIPEIDEKALFVRGAYSSKPGIRAAFRAAAQYETLPPGETVAAHRIVELSSRMDAAGRLEWDVPEGRWTVVRYGQTSTGQTNRPAPVEGLECDKLDKEALDAHFRDFTAKLLEDVAGPSRAALVGTHLDSWEVGAQNWSRHLPEEFRRRRGYELVPWLPVLQGRVVDSLEASERFLWDFRRTLNEVMVENHGRHMRELAHRNGLQFSVEPYDMNPGDDMTLGATGDMPMCEFWTGTFDSRYSVKEATSAAHVYGRPVVGAEALTSGAEDGWKSHPAVAKFFADWGFSEGVNHLVIHRFVHQPFAQVRPGLSLGRNGQHYERTQTWWELSRPWHTYLARCQHMLQQGRWVADALYLSPEGAPNIFQTPLRAPRGYQYDACTPEALYSRVTVKDGKLVLPDGAAYRLLVLPRAETMTPELLERVVKLVEDGATVAGLPVKKSPGWSGYPQCDEAVRKLAAKLWGEGEAPAGRAERRVGKGRAIWGRDLLPLAAMNPPVLHKAVRIWSAGADGHGRRRFRRTVQLDAVPVRAAEVQVVAPAAAVLRVNGSEVRAHSVDLFLEKTRRFRRVMVFDCSGRLRAGANTIEAVLEAGGSQLPQEFFGAVVVEYGTGHTTVLHTGAEWEAATKAGGWTAAAVLGPVETQTPLAPVRDELYPPSKVVAELLKGMGVPPAFTADGTLRFAHRQVDGAEVYFVSNGEDRTLDIACHFRAGGRQPELWHPETGAHRPLPEFSAAAGGGTAVPLRFEPYESYFVVFPAQAGGARTAGRNFPTYERVVEIAGEWEVSFDAKNAGPAAPVRFASLEDWSRRSEEAIRYYSGTATYRKRFTAPAVGADARVLLDLGRVHEFARVRVNGKDLGVLWHRPFRVDATGALRQGENEIEIEITNLWPNRMTGDARLPEDVEWNKWNNVKAWPEWLLRGGKSPTGRVTFSNVRVYTKDSPLLPSGLLGPVALVRERGMTGM